MSKKIFKLSLTLAGLAIVLSACTFPWQKKTPALNPDTGAVGDIALEQTASSTKQIKKFDNYDNLKIFLETNKNISGAADTLNSDSATLVSLDNSKTSDQLIGSEKADIIKTDGNFIYSLVRNEIKIVKINPADSAAVTGTISLKTRPQDIILSGSNLVVYGSDKQGQDSYTFLKVYDLSDPANPRLTRDLNFQGTFTDLRLTGDYVYLFTNSGVNNTVGESPLSRVLDNGTALPTECVSGAKCFAPDVYYFDIPYDSYKFANMAAINIKDSSEAISGQSYLLSSAQSLYVSQNNIFITYSEILNENDLAQEVKKELVSQKLTTEDQDKINKIEISPAYVLSDKEKQTKIGVIFDAYINGLPEEEKTVAKSGISEAIKQKVLAEPQDIEKTFIYKIAINGNKTEYRGMGEVNGQLLSKTSIDENGDSLRIATTRSSIFSRYSDKTDEFFNNIFVLDNNLQVLGSLERLVTKENMTSASFLGDRAYLSSFKPGQPLYAISLSDSSKPAVLGAIKISELFSYLRAADVNGNKLIGYGREVLSDNNGGTTAGGMRLTLFDFSDLNTPKELDSYLIGTATNDSIALEDHKAFFYSEEKGLLSIPSVFKDSGKITFAGTLVFNIANNQLILKDKIDHADAGGISAADSWDGFNYYDNTVKRSLVVSDNLFTFSNRYLKINNLNDLKTVKNVILTSVPNDYIITPAPTSGASTSNNKVLAPGDGPQTPNETIPAPLGEEPVKTIAPTPSGEKVAPTDISTSTPLN